MQREIVPDNFCTIHSWLVQGDSAGPWRPHPVLQSHRKVCLKCLLQLKSPTKPQHLIWIFLTSSYKHQWSYKLASGLSGWLLDLATKLLLRAKGTSGEAGQQLWNSCVWPPLDAQQEHRRSGLLLPWQEGTRAMVVRCFTCSHYMASCRCTLSCSGYGADWSKQPAAHCNYADAPSASPQEKQERPLHHPGGCIDWEILILTG